jgi:hypothetical protein
MNARIVDMQAKISAFVEGSFADWPANVQDYLLAAMEQYERTHNCKIEVLDSRCVRDFDEQPLINVVMRIVTVQ